MSEDAGIEPRAVAWAVRRSNHSARIILYFIFCRVPGERGGAGVEQDHLGRLHREGPLHTAQAHLVRAQNIEVIIIFVTKLL